MSTSHFCMSTCSQESQLHVSNIYMFAQMHVEHFYACRHLMHVVYLTCQPLYAFNGNCMSCAMAHVVMSTCNIRSARSTARTRVRQAVPKISKSARTSSPAHLPRCLIHRAVGARVTYVAQAIRKILTGFARKGIDRAADACC